MSHTPTLFLVLLLTACSSSPDKEPPRDDDSYESGTPGGMMDDEGMGSGGVVGRGTMTTDTMPRWMMNDGMMQYMHVIHRLLTQHEQIAREVEDVPGGVRTFTTSDDPEIAEQIRMHVRQMKERMEEGRPIRQMDPLFRELFDHHEEIHLEYEEIPGGVRVTETSENPAVVALIRQHAHAFVDEVVEHGMRRAMQPTPLPEGYKE